MGAESRTWTDVQGRTVNAEMIGFKGGAVVLKLDSGKEIHFPFANLSPADQQFVRDNAPRDPATAAADIDKLVMDKLKSSYQEIVAQLEKAKADTTMPRADKVKKVEELEFLKRMTWPTERTTDEQFVRRIYLDVAGRIPTYQETVAFLNSRSKDKRAELIDQLLNSEAFVSNFFNYASDLLRIREGLSLNGTRGVRSEAYYDWTKDQIRANTPWDKWVFSMLTAQGQFWENPATGYMLTDTGMQLCNLSNTFTVFAGTEITCAQCHDHPFEEVYQMDFFKMAAFFGGLDLRKSQGVESAKAAQDQLRAYQAEFRQKNAGKTPMPRFDQGLQELLGSYGYVQGDRDEGGKMVPTVPLPHDYKYDDAEPNAQVKPAAYFGELVDLEKYPNARQAFATWLTSKENPRFTINIVNRLWKQVFGLGQIEPVYNIPGHLDGQAQNYDLLKYLEQLMKDLNYDVKGFLRVLYNSQTYQREACHFSPTMAQVDKGEYHFAAPVLRRMSAEQLWDSMVALTVTQPEAAKNRVLEQYQEFMNRDWSKISLDEALKLRQEFSRLGGVSADMMESSSEDMMAMKAGGGAGFIRASEQRMPAPVDTMLYAFGQSDKLLIENANRVGSIPQVMMLLNGDMTNKTMSRKETAVVRNAAEAKNQKDAVNVIFLSILNRRPTGDEEKTATKLVRGEDYTDLIWALLNTREFMFVQ